MSYDENDDYPGYEDQVREQIDRDRDILAGLGQLPTLDDLMSWSRELDEAKLADMQRRERRRNG